MIELRNLGNTGQLVSIVGLGGELVVQIKTRFKLW